MSPRDEPPPAHCEDAQEGLCVWHRSEADELDVRRGKYANEPLKKKKINHKTSW